VDDDVADIHAFPQTRTRVKKLRLVLVLGALGLGPERLWSLEASPAGITELEFEADWATVHRMNTVVHLYGIEASAERRG